MLLYVKYGELSLKGGNRKDFVNCLNRNIKFSLKKFTSVSIKKEYDSCTINSIQENEYEEILEIVKNISGISWIIKGFYSTLNVDEICEDICKQLPKNSPKTFKIETKRQNKNYYLNSMEMNMKLGGLILDKMENYKVNVKNPEIKINVEIKYEKSIFYFDKIPGFGGFPLGINGRILILISGGIDSPVASKLLIKKGFIVDFLTFITPPHTNPKSLEKVEKLIKVITLNEVLYKPKLYICNFTNLQQELSHMSDKTYQITIMRRYFFKIARDLAIQNKYLGIATGESVGQVASQTVQSMQTIQNSINDFLILRPLLTYDKSEIIELAIKFKTYEISIEPYIDCCALFVPKNPVTRPTIHKVLKIEEELDLAEEIYKKIIPKIIIK
ncbi:MAG: tRNA 4-thiouridine(8) synthase ThiI [Mycoplasmataceae bacterium]|nr:tRNA 4-thiouridine(8) synthase ThiI [Mycoplasmataceae bacterium]